MAFFDDFKKFAFKGNILNLAVGVVVGGAFQKIVSAMVDDVVMPMISLMLPSGNWRDAGLLLRKGGATKDDVVLHYGNLLGAMLDFFIVALVLFVLVKRILQAAERTLHLGAEAPAAPATTSCPECLSEVPAQAKRCRACGQALPHVA